VGVLCARVEPRQARHDPHTLPRASLGRRPDRELAPGEYDRSGWVTIVVTRGGGHMGWFQPGGPANRWARRPALEWFRATAEDVTLGPRSARPVESVDGRLVEVGRDDLGCQEIGDGGSIRGDEYHVQFRKRTLDLVPLFLVFFGRDKILAV